MILVTGANGHFGTATIDFLLKKGVNASTLSALVRSDEKGKALKEKGIAIRIGDYDDYASLVKAFQGVDKLMFISSMSEHDRASQHERVVRAAKEAGVKHIVYTSFERKDETEKSPIAMIALSHLATEKALKSSGVDYTIMRNNFYMDYLPMVFGKNVFETGIFYPAGNGKPAITLRSDMAEAAANILTTEGHEGKAYCISNPEQLSFKEIAETLSEVSGHHVEYVSPDPAVYVDVLIKAGVPKMFAELNAGFAIAMAQGELSPEKSDLETLLERKPTSIREFLKEVYPVHQD